MIKGVLVKENKKFIDDRGFFSELVRKDWNELIQDDIIVQINLNHSHPNIIRAWHRHLQGQVDYFICIEGLDKSGKTTQSILLVEALVKNGFDAIYTTEPSNGEIGKFIRRYLLQRKKRMSILVEALLFAADRAQHTEKEIIPMLKNKKVVVSDRYIYSSLAYLSITESTVFSKIGVFTPGMPTHKIFPPLSVELLASMNPAS